MNCPSCFNPNVPENASHCPSCGAKFDQTAQQYGRLCPSGKHTMDPSWQSCAFCKAEAPTGGVPGYQPTVVEPTRGNASGFSQAGLGGQNQRKTVAMNDLPGIPPAPIAPPPAPAVPGWPPPAPVVPSVPLVPQSPAVRERKTVFGVQVPAPQEAPSPAVIAAQTALPRIVAALVSYSNLQNPSGTIFAVREGRNKIGANPDNEISFVTDPTMSGWHASVTFRDGKYYLSAKDTMTGTYLNGVEVPPDSTTLLPNYATLRAGATTFRFIMVDPVEAPEG